MCVTKETQLDVIEMWTSIIQQSDLIKKKKKTIEERWAHIDRLIKKKEEEENEHINSSC